MGFPESSVGKESACNVGDLVRFLGWEDPLDKGKATHSSILAWRISWIPRIESLGSQKVGHNWPTFTLSMSLFWAFLPSRDTSSIPGSRRFHGEGNGSPLQYSCLGNPWTEEPGGATVSGVAELDMTERRSTHTQGCFRGGWAVESYRVFDYCYPKSKCQQGFKSQGNPTTTVRVKSQTTNG